MAFSAIRLSGAGTCSAKRIITMTPGLSIVISGLAVTPRRRTAARNFAQRHKPMRSLREAAPGSAMNGDQFWMKRRTNDTGHLAQTCPITPWLHRFQEDQPEKIMQFRLLVGW